MKLNVTKIKIMMAERGYSVAQTADRCGMNRQGLSVILHRGTCRTTTLKRIADALSVSVAEIVRED